MQFLWSLIAHMGMTQDPSSVGCVDTAAFPLVLSHSARLEPFSFPQFIFYLVFLAAFPKDGRRPASSTVLAVISHLFQDSLEENDP